jgi:hypothetical protein
MRETWWRTILVSTPISTGSSFEKIPLESSSPVSALVTQSTPGIAADSNGLFHGLGDHAENSFSVDGQPITDQQSKVFSNQIPLDSVQSLEVISGAPPAEYGGKTSVVIVATTRSGQGVTTPHGSVTTSYGSFGSSNVAAELAYGGKNWGNFISAGGLNSGRFLDPPEFAVFHDKGNEENLFDRVDFQVTTNDSIHLNFGYSRSWFQTPNSLDAKTRRRGADWPGSSRRMAYLRRHRPERKYRGTNGPALKNWDVQHCSVVDAADQHELRVHPGRIRAPRRLQLLPQQ